MDEITFIAVLSDFDETYDMGNSNDPEETLEK